MHLLYLHCRCLRISDIGIPNVHCLNLYHRCLRIVFALRMFVFVCAVQMLALWLHCRCLYFRVLVLYLKMLVFMVFVLQVIVIVLQGFVLHIDCICITDVCADRTIILFAHVAPTRLACTRLDCTHIDRTNIDRVVRMHTACSHLASYLTHTLHHCSNTNGITDTHMSACACMLLAGSEQWKCDLPCVRACAHTGVHMEEYPCVCVYMISVGARIHGFCRGAPDAPTRRLGFSG